jgi:hypothetical protein
VSERRTFLESGLAGAAVSLALWLGDVLSLRRLSFAGVSDAEAQSRLLDLALPAVVSLEARLLALHLLAGVLFGALAGVAFAADAGPSRMRRGLLAAAFALAAHGLALMAMMGRYPQIYADSWWLAGGWRAGVQRLATHGLGPVVFDGLFLLLLLAAGLAAVRRVASHVRGLRWGRLAGAAGVLAAIVLAAGTLRSTDREAPRDGRPNVLILALDSLRSDRVESPEVMPRTSALASRGTLFLHAFTPVARTFPSWVSLLTGRGPGHTGVRTMFPDLESRRDLGPTFASELRDRGYRTFVVSDFAGDIFPRFRAGLDTVDAPTLTADRLARSTVLAAHPWSLPFLRLASVRAVLPEWRNLASISDPEWLVDKTLAHVRDARHRPFAGIIFFSTPHFPYVAPYPDYLWRAGDYRGRYLYHAPPVAGETRPSEEDVHQVRARYDGAIRATDRAIGRLLDSLLLRGVLERTVVVVTGDHGEELYEQEGVAGHGDTIDGVRSQAVPILISGPGVPSGQRREEQVRLHDLAATLLALALDEPGMSFGDGLDLFVEGAARPTCLETGLWFFPRLPLGLKGRRLEYPGIADLLEVEPRSRELVLREDVVSRVESSKARGIVLGARLWTEQLTPAGRRTALVRLEGIPGAHEEEDLAALFEERCVDGDPALERYLDAIVWVGHE